MVFTMIQKSLIVSAALCCATVLRAQSDDSTPHAAIAHERHTVVTLNPIAAIAAYFTADIEHAVSRSVSVGAAGSLAGSSDFNHYGSLEANVRYYPNEKVLQGFSIGATIGFATARSEYGYTTLAYASPDNGTPTVVYESATPQERVTRATAGTELSYQWLLGPTHHFVIVLGGGVKRAFGEQRYIDPFISSVIPTARVNIGFAF
jgi:hypothetical protein